MSVYDLAERHRRTEPLTTYKAVRSTQTIKALSEATQRRQALRKRRRARAKTRRVTTPVLQAATQPRSRKKARREIAPAQDMSKQLNLIVLLFYIIWMRMRR